MRTSWLSLLLVVVCARAAMAYDHIAIAASLDTSAHAIRGVTEVTWQAPDTSLRELHFRLFANFLCEREHRLHGDSTDSCGAFVDSVIVNGTNLTANMVVTRTDLMVPLGESRTNGALKATVYFRTFLPRKFDRLVYIDETYYLDGWFPMPAPYRDGRWMIVEYDDEAELVGDWYDFDVIMRTPRSMQQIAPGLVSADTVSDTVIARYQLNPSHDFAMVLGRDFKCNQYPEGPTAIKVYHKSRDTERIDSLASAVQFTLRYMAEHVRPYPFSELVVVVGIPFSGGIEFPRMYWQDTPESSRKLRFGAFVAIHETLHQWFYGIIASNQAEAPWMDESITEYFSQRVGMAYAGSRPSLIDGFGFSASGRVNDRLEGQPMMDRLPITRSVPGYSRGEYFTIIYGKGPQVLSTFASLLGPNEDTFWKAYYDEFAFKTPTETDFMKMANQFPPFNEKQNAQEVIEWNRRSDYRITDITTSKADDSVKYKSEIKYDLINPMPFPVKLRYEFANGVTIDTTLPGYAGAETLSVTGEYPVVSADIDPNVEYAVDINRLNNSYNAHGHGAALRLFSGMTFLVQSLFSWLWGW